MSAIDHLLHANQAYAARFPGPRPLRPRLRMAVIACMDSRLDLFGALGLDIGDAHLIRNAGGLPTDDVLRSLALSQRALGTREVVLIHHTECGMHGFTDIRARMRQSVEVGRGCRWIPYRDDVRGFIFDIATARLEEVQRSVPR